MRKQLHTENLKLQQHLKIQHEDFKVVLQEKDKSQKAFDQLKRRKQVDTDGHQIVDLLHERDLLNKNVIKADDRTKKQTELVKRHDDAAEELEKEVGGVKQHL